MKLTLNPDKMLSFALCLFVAYVVMLFPDDALARITAVGSVSTVGGGGGGAYGGASGGGGTIGSLLCGVAGWFTGPVGSGIATLAILVIGIGALMGKVSWGMAIIVGLGVAIIFGAPTIVDELGGAGC